MVLLLFQNKFQFHSTKSHVSYTSHHVHETKQESSQNCMTKPSMNEENVKPNIIHERGKTSGWFKLYDISRIIKSTFIYH